MKNKDMKISLIFTLIGIVSGMFLGLTQTFTATEEVKGQIISSLGSLRMLVVISAVQSGLFAFFSTFIGLKLSRKVNLKLNFTFDKNGFLQAAIIGGLSSFIFCLSDKFIFAKYLPAPTGSYKFSPLYFVASVLYGGVVEELMLRLFFMSLIVLILWKLFAKGTDSHAIPSWIYIVSIFIATILFAAGHLPATSQLLGLSTPIVIRAFLLNGVAGVGFGYLYWKKGLSYAILAHMLTHVFNQFIFMPMFF